MPSVLTPYRLPVPLARDGGRGSFPIQARDALDARLLFSFQNKKPQPGADWGTKNPQPETG